MNTPRYFSRDPCGNFTENSYSYSFGNSHTDIFFTYDIDISTIKSNSMDEETCIICQKKLPKINSLENFQR